MTERLPTRPTPPDAVEQVAALPRRTAHATYALLATCEDQHGPAIASEVVIFDSEALSAFSTGRALAAARRRGLAQHWGGGVWAPSNLAYDLRGALEDRFLADTDRGGEDG